MTSSPGDTLLFAVSAKTELSWPAFAELLDAVFVPDARVGTDVKHVRSAVAALGDSLAHWDIVPHEGTARVCVAPPALATLPRPGLPTAVLCGSRSPDTLPALAAACAGGRATVRSTPQRQSHPYAPTLIEVTTESHERIGEVANALRIHSTPVPAAWALAQACGFLGGYLESLSWGTGPDLNWLRRDFDPIAQRFTSERQDGGTGLRLSAYQHPGGWAREDRLWRGDEYAAVDRNWGRFAVLAGRDVVVCNYDHGAGKFSVPRQLPLPRIVARALGLCSGRPPAVSLGEGLGRTEYAQVPQGIAGALVAKLGQHCGDSQRSTEDEIA